MEIFIHYQLSMCDKTEAIYTLSTYEDEYYKEPLLLTKIDFNVSMDKLVFLS